MGVDSIEVAEETTPAAYIITNKVRCHFAASSNHD